MSSSRADKRGLVPCTMVCKNCPEYMYSFETLRETWLRACNGKGRQYYERIKYYFNHTFDRHLKEIVLVIAYGADQNAGIFLDFTAYKFFKERVEKEIGQELTEVLPVKVSRKTPQIMRMFTSLKDFIRFSDQLRHKNRAIARQRYVNGVYLLERVNEVMEQKEPLFLAFSAKISEHDPKAALQIGCVIFSLESQQGLQKYHYHHKNENLLLTSNNVLQDKHGDCNFPFGSTEVASLDAVLSKMQEDISRVDFLVTYSISLEGIQNFFRAQGLKVEAKETIDTLTLHAALFHESRKENSMEDILNKLEVPFETHRLLNAGYMVDYIRQMFRALLSQEFCICLNL